MTLEQFDNLKVGDILEYKKKGRIDLDVVLEVDTDHKTMLFRTIKTTHPSDDPVGLLSYRTETVRNRYTLITSETP
jgi:hypothetical protein